MKVLSRACALITSARTIVVAGHINPDGDTIGSLLALGIGLQRLGKDVTFLCADTIPAQYKKLPGAAAIVRRAPGRYDLAIAVDCSKQEMLGTALKTFRRSRNILEIDHHLHREPFGGMQLVDTTACAVGELIYRIVTELKLSFDADIAANILTSIIVETNSFRLPCLQERVFRICAALLRTGVDFYKITEMVYWSRSPQSAILEGLALSRCRFLCAGKVVWSHLDRTDFRRAGGAHADTDAVADEMRAIAGVDAAVLFRENDKNQLRISLRSKRGLNVAEIAEQYGGGGHADIAGCCIANTPAARRGLLRRLVNLVQKKSSGAV